MVFSIYQQTHSLLVRWLFPLLFFKIKGSIFFAKYFRERCSKWHLVVLTLGKTSQTELFHLMCWCSLLKSNPSLQHLHQSLILSTERAQGLYLPGWNLQFTYFTWTLTSHFTSLSYVMLLAIQIDCNFIFWNFYFLLNLSTV